MDWNLYWTILAQVVLALLALAVPAGVFARMIRPPRYQINQTANQDVTSRLIAGTRLNQQVGNR